LNAGFPDARLTDEGVHLASGSEDLNGRYRLALTDDGLAVHQVCSTGLQGLERAQTIVDFLYFRGLGIWLYHTDHRHV